MEGRGKEVFRVGDEVAYQAFLDKGTAKGTAKVYASRWKVWQAYIKTRAEEEGRTVTDGDLY